MKRQSIVEKCKGRTPAAARWVKAIDKVMGQLARLRTEDMLIEHLSPSDTAVRLLYEGSKVFWRLRETISVSMYSHLHANCIEIISFCPRLNRELNRIYIDYAKLMTHSSVALTEMSSEQFEAFYFSAHSKTTEDITAFENYANSPIENRLDQRFLFEISFVLARLSLEEQHGVVIPMQMYRPHVDDPPDIFLPERPKTLRPVLLLHRRWSSVQSKFDATSKFLHEDIQKAGVSIDRAVALENHLRSGAEAFMSAGRALSSKYLDNGTLSFRSRVVKAMRRTALHEAKIAIVRKGY
jgi:hypothetical protein